MNVVALIIWFSAAAGRLLFRAARLIEHTAASGCRRHVPACVSDLRPGLHHPGGSGSSVWHGAMR